MDSSLLLMLWWLCEGDGGFKVSSLLQIIRLAGWLDVLSFTSMGLLAAGGWKKLRLERLSVWIVSQSCWGWGFCGGLSCSETGAFCYF